ncbi:MAG: hypothetical protein CME64_14205 [Halobacteriovoraceae bacterium]|nr:hypothetical protein [Halobacteriovoraceae bacterium]|tara:strand:+ start:45277 stop:45588 length:312 start_codon:yes stop_codon:yes gene_type:complete
MVKLKARPLNLSTRKIKEIKKKGFISLTFIGENLQPFHCFAKEDELARFEADVVEFKWGRESIVAKFIKLVGEGWSSSKDIMLYEVLDTPVATYERDPIEICA